MARRSAIRPPRRPSRSRPLAAGRPVLLAVLAVVLGLLLPNTVVWLAAKRSSDTRNVLWHIQVANRSGAALGNVTLLAVPSERGFYPIAKCVVPSLAAGTAQERSMIVPRACDVRVEITIGGEIHVFEQVAKLGPGHDPRVRIEITPGLLVNGRPARRDGRN